MSAAHRKTSPTLTLVAGPNGSGKSTIVSGLDVGSNLGVLVNADQIALAFAKRKGEASPSVDTQWEAARSAEDMRWALVSQRISFVAETVMSDLERWRRFLTEAKAQGYRIVLIFVTTAHPAINVARVSERVQAGGHAVEPNKVVARYHKVMDETLPVILPMVDEAVLFDNSSPETGAVAVAVMQKGALVMRVPEDQLPDWTRRLVKRLKI